MKYRTVVMYMEIGCFVSCLCGWILVCSTLPTEYWTFSEVGSIVLTTSNYYSNLWRDCISDTTGVSDCKDYPSMLALPGFCGMITYSWWANRVISEFVDPNFRAQNSPKGPRRPGTYATARTRRTYVLPASASRVTLGPPLFYEGRKSRTTGASGTNQTFGRDSFV
ncbi:unnamed protein product [Tetraodon nigroviridis]|uniref:Claudin n=1 Tax=Tetraodon nigroviridis TaxID=99883 RepID=Q4S332_TETNG|nr:unnamed protein product [Tetraodon nigroviridis]